MANSLILSDSALSCSGIAPDSQDASPSNKWQHPPSFYCPISQQVMHDPVVVSDGHTYERRHIERWLQGKTTSPVTRKELSEKAVFPNHALRNAITEYFDQVFSVHRRAIRTSIRGQGEQLRFGSNEPLLQTIDALMQCSFLMNADLNTECVLRQIMNEAKNLLGAEAASVFLVDAAKQELYSKINSTDKEIRIPTTSGIAGHVASTGEPLIIPDAYQDDRFNRTHDMKTGFKTDNILCVPLKLKRGAVIGVVQMINKTGAGVFCRSQAFSAIAEEENQSKGVSRPGFTAHDLQFLQVFASQAATAVSNSGGVLQNSEASTAKDEAKCMDSTASMDLKKTAMEAAPPSDADAAEKHQQPTGCTQQFFPTSAECEVASLLDGAFRSWQFDSLRLAELTDNKPLSTLGLYLFDRMGFVEEFGFDTQKLAKFLMQIEEGYDDANKYHNRAHAASVMHSMHALLENGGIANVIAPAFQGTSTSGACHLQRLACLLAAAVHDHEHLGLTNEFLVRTRHERAMLYNDQSVNENHHVASSFRVLNQAECNFLVDLPEEDFHKLRSMVIDLVLCTDMAKGGDIQKLFDEAFDASREVCKHAVQTPTSTQEATLLLQMAMKCADLGHLALDWDIHEKWVSREEAEFFAQGDKEKAAGIPVSFRMDRDQPGCLKTHNFEFVALPILQSLVKVIPAAEPMLKTAMTNYWRWQEVEGQKVCSANASRSDVVMARRQSLALDDDDEIPMSKMSSLASTAASDTSQDPGKSKKKSGRSRQRAAKYWASVRCRTPSPEPIFGCHPAQRC